MKIVNALPPLLRGLLFGSVTNLYLLDYIGDNGEILSHTKLAAYVGISSDFSTVSAPSADSNKSFVVYANNVRLNFTSKTNLDPIPFRMVGGQKID